jgi:hypothetical protein
MRLNHVFLTCELCFFGLRAHGQACMGCVWALTADEECRGIVTRALQDVMAAMELHMDKATVVSPLSHAEPFCGPRMQSLFLCMSHVPRHRRCPTCL